MPFGFCNVLAMPLRRSGIAVLVTFLPSLAIATHSCWVASHQYLCCATLPVFCSVDEDLWTCTNTSSFPAGYTVSTVTAANPNQAGKDTFTSSVKGTCTLTPETCGPTPGSCIVGSMINVSCVDTKPSGSSCFGQ